MKALLLSLTLLASAAAAQDVAVHFDPAQAQVRFTLSDVLHTVHGTFHLKSGEIHFDGATGAASGQLIVDAASGDSGSGARDGRMKKNILETQKYPDIVFAPDRVDGKLNPQGDSQVRVHGSFSIHGASHELTVPVTVHASPQAMDVDAHFDVPYVQWGMKNPSTLFLRVGDRVNIEIHAAGRIQSNS